MTLMCRWGFKGGTCSLVVGLIASFTPLLFPIFRYPVYIYLYLQASRLYCGFLPPPFPSLPAQVCVFAFACLYINGRSLLREPLEERRKALYGALKEVEGEMQFATAKTSRDVDELQVCGCWRGGD